MKKILLLTAALCLFSASICLAALSEDQKFNVNYAGVGGEKLSFDYAADASQILVKNKAVKGKPIDILLSLKPRPDAAHDRRSLYLRRMDIAGKSFWYIKSCWTGDGQTEANTQFWLIGQANGKIVPYATEQIFGGGLGERDELHIMPAQSYRQKTAAGLYDPVPVIVLERRRGGDYAKTETAVLFWDEAARWFSYTGKYLYPHPIYVNGKPL